MLSVTSWLQLEIDHVFRPGALQPFRLQELEEVGSQSEGEEHAVFPRENWAVTMRVCGREESVERHGLNLLALDFGRLFDADCADLPVAHECEGYWLLICV